MGLDMYAVRKLNVKRWNYQSPNERYTVQVRRGGKPVAGIQSNRISGVEEEVMYWRKANHIHGWFVDNVQKGNDDCKEYHVSWDNLLKLHEACYEVASASKLVDGMVNNGTVYDQDHPKGQVLRTAGKVIEDATVAKELLPTREGFFFGSAEYDEDYDDNVNRTLAWVVSMLKDHKNGVPGDIYYSSSW